MQQNRQNNSKSHHRIGQNRREQKNGKSQIRIQQNGVEYNRIEELKLFIVERRGKNRSPQKIKFEYNRIDRRIKI